MGRKHSTCGKCLSLQHTELYLNIGLSVSFALHLFFLVSVYIVLHAFIYFILLYTIFYYMHICHNNIYSGNPAIIMTTEIHNAWTDHNIGLISVM